MKIRMNIVHEYDTGDEVETFNNYRTTDPAECVAIDRENIEMLGIVDFLSLGSFDELDMTCTLEAVDE